MKRLKEKSPYHPNKLYCSEILSILLQATPENRAMLGDIDGIDILLQQLAVSETIEDYSYDGAPMFQILSSGL